MTPFKVWRESTSGISTNIIKLSRFFYKDLNEFDKHLSELAHSSDVWLKFLKNTRNELKAIKTAHPIFGLKSEVERLFTTPEGEIIPIFKLLYALDYAIGGAEYSKKKPTVADVFDFPKEPAPALKKAAEKYKTHPHQWMSPSKHKTSQ